ncbi:MAG: LysR family transcriptional regulator [Thalassotalea sp.]|nr:LysR family transcriptional regulator [Thalassotalea sp.]MDG2394565.1 LysR family transcriptional regulator [Thalassotalea sp.]
MSIGLRKVDLNLLNVFAELIKNPHLTNTAKRLNMTQPAVSMALQRLRSLYDDSLFIREGRAMVATAKALEIAPEIEQALELITSTLPNTESFVPATAKVKFKMNIFGYAEQVLAADFVKKLHNESPNSALYISSEYMVDADKLLRDRRTDIHIDYKPVLHPDFKYYEASREDLVVIANKNHPRLKQKKIMTMDDFFREKHAVALSPDGSEFISDKVIKDFDYITKKREIGYHGSSALGVLSIIAKSDMITLVPKHLVKSINEYKEFLQFTPPFECNELVTYINWYVGMQYDPSHLWFKEFVIKNTHEYYLNG